MITPALQYTVLYYIRYISTLREKKCIIQEIFHSDTSMYATKTLQLSFFFCIFMPRKKNTTTNMSEEYLGNMHISQHIISKIIQSILGYPPEQLLSLLFYPPPKSKSLVHPTPALQMLFTSFISFSLCYNLIIQAGIIMLWYR